MSEQWGRWFADPPRDEPAEQPEAVEDQHVESVRDENGPADELGSNDAPVAESEPIAVDVAQDEPVAPAASDAAAEDESSAVAEPVAEPEAADDGDPAVSAVYALRQRLGELEELPIEEHPARYEQLHAELTAALGRIDGGA